MVSNCETATCQQVSSLSKSQIRSIEEEEDGDDDDGDEEEEEEEERRKRYRDNSGMMCAPSCLNSKDILKSKKCFMS